MTMQFEEEIPVEFPFDHKALALEVINASLDHEDFPYECEVSVTLTDEESIRSINKEFRNIDSATDVLSFPMIDYPAPGDFSRLDDSYDIFDPETGEAMLGDIVLCVPRIYSQAEEYGHSVKREYAFLIAHSMLHLLGYDHMEEDERVEMEARQDEILTSMNITRND